MVVNAKGRAVTQRMEPSLALVEVDMPPEAFADAEDRQPDPDSNSHMMGNSVCPFQTTKATCSTLPWMIRATSVCMQLSEHPEWTR